MGEEGGEGRGQFFYVGQATANILFFKFGLKREVNAALIFKVSEIPVKGNKPG